MVKDKNKILKIMILIASLAALSYAVISILFLGANITNFSIINNAYNEIRDYVSFRLTHFIIEGTNPYTVDYLNQTNVPFMLLYPGLNPLLAAIICRSTGVSVMAGYYIVNILVYLATALNVWLIVRNYFKESKWIAAICVLVNASTFFALFGLPIFNFHTDSIGIYLTSVIFLIIYKNKRLTLPVAILTVMLIFTKQILVVFAVPMFMYYFIIDRKLSLKYFLQCTICGIITLVVIQILFPLYWTETIYAQFFVSKSYGNLKDALFNIAHFYYRYFAYFILIVVGTIGGIRLKLNNWRDFSLTAFIKELISEHEFAVYLILNIIFGTFFLLYFAKCGGDGYKYCQDILALSWFILAVYVWHNYFSRLIDQKMAFKLSAKILLFILCLASSFTYSRFKINYYDDADERTFITLNDIISSHSGEKMYLGMNSTQYMLNNDIWEPDDVWFNDGQIEYLNEDYPDNPILDFLFYGKEIETVAREYVNEVNAMVANKDFGIIVTCLDCVIDKNVLSENYVEYTMLGVRTDTNGIYDVTVWIPSESE